MEYDLIKIILRNKFRFTINMLKREGLIAGYNSKVYKRVDIDVSLSNDMTKPNPDTNEVHLIFKINLLINH